MEKEERIQHFVTQRKQYLKKYYFSVFIISIGLFLVVLTKSLRPGIFIIFFGSIFYAYIAYTSYTCPACGMFLRFWNPGVKRVCPKCKYNTVLTMEDMYPDLIIRTYEIRKELAIIFVIPGVIFLGVCGYNLWFLAAGGHFASQW